MEYSGPVTLGSALSAGIGIGLMLGLVVGAIPASQNGHILTTMAPALAGGACVGAVLGLAYYALVVVLRTGWSATFIRRAVKWGIAGVIAGFLVGGSLGWHIPGSMMLFAIVGALFGALSAIFRR
ncbi:MAG: hypothetical protein QM656_08200 [Paracoccaceae bacterium]